MGCPQNNAGVNLPGRIFLVFLRSSGDLFNYVLLPSTTDTTVTKKGLQHNDNDPVAPRLGPIDRFGSAMTGFQDLDRNGIREVVIGMNFYICMFISMCVVSSISNTSYFMHI